MSTAHFLKEKKTLAKLVVFVLENRILSDQSTLKRPTWSPTTKNAKTDYITDTDAFAENIWHRCLPTLFTNRQESFSFLSFFEKNDVVTVIIQTF
jgi:hypothetical protein